MNEFMKRAIDLAVNNVKEGGQPFGAVLVKDGEVIAEGVNELHFKHDVSGHAELLAIRRAQNKLQTDNLEGYTMYASGEPCAMCLTAMYFVGIKKVYYSATVEDTEKVGLGKSKEIYADLAKANEEREIKMVHVPIIEGVDNPLKLWVSK